jgi:two-component system, OmpR family, alkaline phosphatase synthesis response regulator PhoP
MESPRVGNPPRQFGVVEDGGVLMFNIIVLAEDEPVIGQVVQVALERAGYIVFWRTNGIDAWDSIQSSTPDLVILDQMMPGLSGLQVLSKMHATAETRRIPVIMATSKGHKSDIVAALKGGAADYLVKPYGMAELVERVHRVLEPGALGKPSQDPRSTPRSS